MSDKPPPYTERTERTEREGLQGQENRGYGTIPPPVGAYNIPQPKPAGAYDPRYQRDPSEGYNPAAYPPQPGYSHPPGHQGYPAGGYVGPGYIGSQQQHVIVHQQPPTEIVIVGGCPACRVGVLEEDYTCLGVLCAILFFPLGLLCCLAMRQRRCPNCGAVFD